MPRKASKPSVADLNVAAGGVAAVDRALSLLNAFTLEQPALSLNELAERTQLYKSTILRLIASLIHARLLQKRDDGRYVLGAAAARLHHIYSASFSMREVVMPVLLELTGSTQESSAFYVRQGDQRLCLHRVDSPRPVRDHLSVGDLLPMDRGAGGRILTAFTGAKGKLYEQIRTELSAILVGDRVPELASIGAPVFGASGDVAGALTLTMPAERLDRRYLKNVKAAARQITEGLGGIYPNNKKE